MTVRRTSTASILAMALTLVVAGVWSLLFDVPPAAAHADLVSAVPAVNAGLQTSPPEIVLTFSEQPDPALSVIQVVDTGGAAVGGTSAVQGVPGSSLAIRVAVTRQLPRGIYSVNWRCVSADDGHVTTGVYGFGVGVSPPPGSAVSVRALHTSGWISLGGATGRWLLYLGLALLVGAAAICTLIFGGRLPAGGVAVTRWAIVAAIVGLCLSIAAERAAVGAPRLLPLFETREGRLLLAQGVALALCVAAVVLLGLEPSRWALAVLGATAAMAMLVHVYAGHAYSPAHLRVFHVVTQWVHVVAVGVWLGGLPWLLMGLREADRGGRSRAVVAFARIATLTLAVVLATGLARAFAEVGTVHNLVGSTYGVTLLIKIALVAGLATLGALQHFRSVPRAAADGDAVRPLQLTARGEVALAALVLATTAVLSGLAPPRF
jgi:copper transport protein